MKVSRFIKKCKKGYDIVKLRARPSYAQAGEDLIVNYYFESVNIKKPTYLEIGTNEPILHNNTYFFYLNKCVGVCIEPDSNMIGVIKKKRPNDIVLNVGIGTSEGTQMPFYTFPEWRNSWNTFSQEEAELRQKTSGIKYSVEYIDLKTVNGIIETHFDKTPDFISIDVEGLDLDILQSIDYNRYKPEVICVETITFSTNHTEKKINSIAAFMDTVGYYPYADTHINTIFARKDRVKTNT